MVLSNANKALLITILLASTVVLMAFNVHISKKNELIAETYFDLLPEEDIIKEIESLEEILESFNELTTNKAFNENKTNEDFEVNEVISEKASNAISEDNGLSVYILRKNGIDKETNPESLKFCGEMSTLEYDIKVSIKTTIRNTEVLFFINGSQQLNTALN